MGTNQRGRLALAGLIAVAVAGGCGTASHHAAAPSQTAKPAAVSSSSSPDCQGQVHSWDTSSATKAGNDLSQMSTDGQAFLSDLQTGSDTSADVSAITNDSSALISDASAAMTNPPPTCVPGMRTDFLSAMRDYIKAADDEQTGAQEAGNGDIADAAAKVATADSELAAGNKLTRNATADLNAGS